MHAHLQDTLPVTMYMKSKDELCCFLYMVSAGTLPLIMEAPQPREQVRRRHSILVDVADTFR